MDYDYLKNILLLHSSLTFSLSINNFHIYIQPYFDILREDIDHDIHQLGHLPNLISEFQQNQIIFDDTISSFSQLIGLVPYQHNHKYHHIIRPLYDQIQTSLISLSRSFDQFKTNYIDKIIPDIRSNINKLQNFQPKLIDSKSKIIYMPSIDEINKFKDHLYSIIHNDEISLNIESMKTLLKSMERFDHLSNEVHRLRMIITREKNTLYKLIEKVNWWKSVIPDQIYHDKTRKKQFQDIVHLFPVYKSIVANIDKEILSKKQLMEYSREIEKFLSELSDNVEYIISFTDSLKLSINPISKIRKLKFKFYDLRIIKNILQKIQTIEMITKSLETSKLQLQKLQLDENIKMLMEYTNPLTNILKSIEFILYRIKYIKSNLLNIKSLKINSSLIKEQIDYTKYNINRMVIILENLKRLEITEDQLECIIRMLDPIKYYNYFNIKPFEEQIKYVIREIENLKIYVKLFKKLYSSFLNFKYEVESKLKCVESSINKLECAIEGVARNLVRCSLQSTNNHTIHSIVTSLGVDKDNELDNQIYVLNSLTGITSYNSLVNRLFQMLDKTDGMLNMLNRVEYCQCLTRYNRENKNGFRLSDRFKFSHEYSHSKFHLKRVMANEGNHVCLCIVTNYVLYPRLVKAMCYLMDYDLDALGTLSRKYDKYTNTTSFKEELGRFCILIIEVIEVVAITMNDSLRCTCKEAICKCVTRSKTRQNTGSTVNDSISYELYKWFTFLANMAYNLTTPIHQGIIPNILRCYCMYSDDPDYHNLISIILFVSTLVENIWTMDPESIRMSIESISSLLFEFEMIDSQSNKSTDSKSNPVFDDIKKCLFCPLKFCTISSKLQIILDFISFCSYDPYLSSSVKPHILKFSFTNPDQFLKFLEELTNMNRNSTGKYFGNLFDKYKSIDSEKNICCQFKNQCCVLSSNCVIIMGVLISYIIKSKLYTGKCPELKERLSSLKSLCNCNDSDCCLKQLIGSASTICNGNNGCEELLKKCVDLCCDKCCNSGCPCKHLKPCCDKLKDLCSNSGQNGLCKILDKIKECQCSPKQRKNSCMDCVCCKIVAESILILQNMFRNCVWNISKNVIVTCRYLLEIVDKIKQTNNSLIIIRRIVNNYFNYDKLAIRLVKDSYTSYPESIGGDMGVKDASTANWGYDTSYEHDIASANSYKGDGYPSLYCRGFRTGNRGGKKMFKLVLSRLMISCLVVFMFVYLRISYQQFLLVHATEDIGTDNNLDITKNTKNDMNRSNYLVDMFLNSNDNYTTNYSSTEIDTNTSNSTRKCIKIEI